MSKHSTQEAHDSAQKILSTKPSDQNSSNGSTVMTAEFLIDSIQQSLFANKFLHDYFGELEQNPDKPITKLHDGFLAKLAGENTKNIAGRNIFWPGVALASVSLTLSWLLDYGKFKSTFEEQLKTQESPANGKNLYEFAKSIRNAFAHGHIEYANPEKTIIRFSDKKPNAREYHFQHEFDTEQFSEFIKTIFKNFVDVIHQHKPTRTEE